MPSPNLELLELAAERLRQLLPEIVFVGGCATGLLIDDGRRIDQRDPGTRRHKNQPGPSFRLLATRGTPLREPTAIRTATKRFLPLRFREATSA
jgi:hypothetical protein